GRGRLVPAPFFVLAERGDEPSTSLRNHMHFLAGRVKLCSMDKDQVARILGEIEVLLEIKGENPFKARAYVNAARALERLDEPLDKVVTENRLGEIRGVGDALQKKITE